MSKLNIQSLIMEFFHDNWGDDKVEIYNEFSLQHELGMFLRKKLDSKYKRKKLDSKYKVQFERNISYFFDDTQSDLNYKTKNQEFIKKEIDICIFDSSKNEKYAIELKFPNNGQVPEQMFSFIRDIKFMEQLREFGFTEAYCVCLVNNSDFYDVKDKNEGIYSYFRGEVKEIYSNREIKKPTGKNDKNIILNNSYKIHWNQLEKTQLKIESKRKIKDPIKFYIVQIKDVE